MIHNSVIFIRNYNILRSHLTGLNQDSWHPQQLNRNEQGMSDLSLDVLRVFFILA